MLIENYKGIEIFHDANKDEFYTKIVIRKSSNGKKDEFISFPRLQRTRDELDKFLNTAGKKPVVKKAWLKLESRNGYNCSFEKVDVVLYNSISQTTQIKKSDGKLETLKKTYYSSDSKLFLCCKENDAIVASLIKANSEIEKIQKSVSCGSGKLIPMLDEHFT
jgi:hypothetical protein